MEGVSIDWPQFWILGYVAFAMLLGAIIGLDREIARKPAGLRTHMLVAGAATLFVTLGDLTVERFNAELGGQIIRSDPIRVIEAVITGASFLGAGTIIRHGSTQSVEGLTTAASILFATAVGVAVALSHLLLAFGLTMLVLVPLRVLGLVVRWLRRWNLHETNVSP